MMRQKLSPAESIHVLNVIYQNPFMGEKLITRIHSCVKFYLPEPIHASKVIYQNPSMCQTHQTLVCASSGALKSSAPFSAET